MLIISSVLPTLVKTGRPPNCAELCNGCRTTLGMGYECRIGRDIDGVTMAFLVLAGATNPGK